MEIIAVIINCLFEVVVAQEHERVTVNNLIFLLLFRSAQSHALSSATQHAMSPEFSRKWRTEGS